MGRFTRQTSLGRGSHCAGHAVVPKHPKAWPVVDLLSHAMLGDAHVSASHCCNEIGNWFRQKLTGYRRRKPDILWAKAQSMQNICNETLSYNGLCLSESYVPWFGFL
jgi:hypothetical protein